MIVAMVIVLVIALALGLAVAVRHFQLEAQLVELDQQIEELEVQLAELGSDYFTECEIDALIQKRNNIRRKMFF